MKKIIVVAFIIMIALCGCKNEKNLPLSVGSSNNIKSEISDEDMAKIQELAMISEDYDQGYTLDENSKYTISMGILNKFGLGQKYNNDWSFDITVDEVNKIAAMFITDDNINKESESGYGYSEDRASGIVLEPYEIISDDNEVSVLFGRFINDISGAKHWLYPVRYTFEESVLTDSDIAAVLSDFYKSGDKVYKLKSIENYFNFVEAKEIYTSNGYADLFLQKSYTISSAEDILQMAMRVNSGAYNEATAEYSLTCDIDMSGIDFEPIGQNIAIMDQFDQRCPEKSGYYGTFNGNGYTIKNLKFIGKSTPNSDNGDCFGFFSILSSGATVNSLNFENAEIGYTKSENCSVKAGIIVGSLRGGIIEKCKVSGTVSGTSDVGGIAGYAGGDFWSYSLNDNIPEGIIYDCESNVEVLGQNNVGAIAGTNHRTQIVSCKAKGTVTGLVINNNSEENSLQIINIGGLAGHNVWADVNNSYADVFVKTMDGARCVGSFVGLNEGNIYNCFYNKDSSNWKPCGDSPRDDLTDNVQALTGEEYKNKIAE